MKLSRHDAIALAVVSFLLIIVFIAGRKMDLWLGGWFRQRVVTDGWLLGMLAILFLFALLTICFSADKKD